jgi:hypothetical protein
MTRTHLSNWRSPPRPVEKTHGAENCITGDTGKTVDGERVAEGPAVAVKRANARGAKRPCLLCKNSNKKEGKGE